jgi:oligosaccharyltransferase complex subunit gamma
LFAKTDGILAFAFYTLAVTIPKLSTDPIRQRFGIYVWSGVLVVMFGILTSLFRMKNPGYPFRILF